MSDDEQNAPTQEENEEMEPKSEDPNAPINIKASLCSLISEATLVDCQ